MPVKRIDADAENLVLTVEAEFDAPLEKLWNAYTDPRQLERFWGPPGYPATFHQLDPVVGGHAFYTMTSPQGDVYGGTWDFTEVDPPNSFTVVDKFADASGNPIEDMPSGTMTMRFASTPSGSKYSCVSYFPSIAAMEQQLEMGVVEGMRAAMNQIDLVLEDLAELADATQAEPLDEKRARISRAVRGDANKVWRAMTDAALIPEWMFGPDGWVMTECDFAPVVGKKYRWGWAPEPGCEGEPFTVTGEVLHVDAPKRLVTTENYSGDDAMPMISDLNLYSDGARTLVSYILEFPDAATRDGALSGGMMAGMEAGFARIDAMT